MLVVLDKVDLVGMLVEDRQVDLGKHHDLGRLLGGKLGTVLLLEGIQVQLVHIGLGPTAVSICLFGVYRMFATV